MHPHPHPTKEKITPIVRENFIKLAEGFKFLKITRWVYVVVTVLISLKSSLQQIFLGPFSGWFTASDQTSFTNFPIGLLLIGIIIISVPRLWGNIRFIIHLKRTARNMNDNNIYRASRFQITRIFLYALNIILITLLVIHMLNWLDLYYKSIHIRPDLARILLDLARYNVIIGMDATIVLIITFYGLFALLEKLVNYLTWKEFGMWVQNQISHIEEARNSQSVQKIRKGSSIMKYGILMMIIESLIGNIVFNIGLSKMEQGFGNYPNINIYINPIPRSLQRRADLHRLNYAKLRQSPIQEYQYGHPISRGIGISYNNSRKPLRTNTETAKVFQNISNFCGYCGEKIEVQEARFCVRCGNRI